MAMEDSMLPPSAPPEFNLQESFASMDRGLKLFIIGAFVGVIAMFVSIYRMVKAAFGDEGWDFSEHAEQGAHAGKVVIPKKEEEPTPKQEIKPVPEVKKEPKVPSGPAMTFGDRGAARKSSTKHSGAIKEASADDEEGEEEDAGDFTEGEGKVDRPLCPTAKRSSSKGRSQTKSSHKRDTATGDDDDDYSENGRMQTRLSFQTSGGRNVKIHVDLSGISSMARLQARVVQEWTDNIGGKMPSGLMMEYADEEGEFIKVTKHTPIKDVMLSPDIRMLPKARAPAAETIRMLPKTRSGSGGVNGMD